MFKKPESGALKKNIDTLIGPETFFKGNIESRGSVRIDGRVEGNLIVQGDVLIGNNGDVAGNIEAENVFISGVVEGNVTAAGTLTLSSTSKLYGDINVSSFVSEDGSIFNGRCNMINAGAAEGEAEPVSVKQNEKKSGLKREFKKSSLLEDTGEDKTLPTSG